MKPYTVSSLCKEIGDDDEDDCGLVLLLLLLSVVEVIKNFDAKFL